MPYQNQHRREPVPTDLWQAYRASFEDFARQAAEPEKSGADLEQARAAHANARNALADTLLEKQNRRKMVCA